MIRARYRKCRFCPTRIRTMVTKHRNVYCSIECKQGFRKLQRAGKDKPPEPLKPGERCDKCEGMCHRRPRTGCPRCGEDWGPDIVYASDHMYRSSNFARAAERAVGCVGLSWGAETR